MTLFFLETQIMQVCVYVSFISNNGNIMRKEEPNTVIGDLLRVKHQRQEKKT